MEAYVKKSADKWSLNSAVACIKRNGGKIDSNNLIHYQRPGIKILGCIDYLCNYHGFRW